MFLRKPHNVAATLLAVAVLWLASAPGAETPPPPPPPSMLSVLVSERHAQLFAATVVLRGQTEASRRLNLRARTEGVVATTPAREGDPLNEGDAILTFDMEDRDVRHEEADAVFRQRQAELEAATQLARKGHRSALKLAATQALFAKAKADRRRAELNVAYATVAAPFTGVLVKREVEIGQYVKNGDHLGSMVELDPLLLAAEAGEQDVVVLKNGQKARATLADGTSLEGVISYVAPAADLAKRTFRVEARAANPDHLIPEGLSADIAVYLPEVMAHAISPALLTLNDDGELGLKTVDARNRVVFHPVRILGEDERGMWVEGLPQQAMLILRGQDFALHGEEVRPVFEDAPETEEEEAGDMARAPPKSLPAF